MKITAIIPLYNGKDTILTAIKSVMDQTCSLPIEIIVVNDGSRDGCEILVDNLINKDINRRIKIINKENGGVSSARNRGIEEARGDWIGFLDADDVWLPEKLEKQIIEIDKNPTIRFIGSNRNGNVYPFFKKSEYKIFTLNTNEIIFKWHPHTSTAFVKKEVFLESGVYDESRSHAEDGDMLLRISEKCPLFILNEDLVFTGAGKRGFGESGLSGNMPAMYNGEILALKGARNRHQISFLEYLGFYIWLSVKYVRRIFIVTFARKN